MHECPLAKPKPLEKDTTCRNMPPNRAAALAFTIHDMALMLLQFSSCSEKSGVDTVIAQIEAQCRSYRQMETGNA